MKSEIARVTTLTPTSGQERFEFLDVLRGCALFGIITANMISYSLYLYLPESAKVSMSTYTADMVLDFVELFLIEGKFYTIFSVLFGVGFSILLTRAQARELVFHRFFLRRVFFLFLIGAVHAILFWHNDILESYALCGALLLPFVKASNRTILAFAALALLAPAVITVTGLIPADSFTAPRDLIYDRFGFTSDTRVAVTAGGSFAQIVKINLGNWFGQVDYVVSSGMLFKIFGFFLLGFYVGRNEIYKNLHEYRPIIKRIALLGLAVGLPLNVIYAATFYSTSWLHTVSDTVAVLPLSAGYASLLCLIWIGPSGNKLLHHFAPVGRMALTNYVGQSVICTLIFYGTGLGMGGTMGPTLYLPVGIAVYLFQVIASRFWLSHFRFGPLEWLWRMLTYGSWIPLAK